MDWIQNGITKAKPKMKWVECLFVLRIESSSQNVHCTKNHFKSILKAEFSQVKQFFFLNLIFTTNISEIISNSKPISFEEIRHHSIFVNTWPDCLNLNNIWESKCEYLQWLVWNSENLVHIRTRTTSFSLANTIEFFIWLEVVFSVYFILLNCLQSNWKSFAFAFN